MVISRKITVYQVLTDTENIGIIIYSVIIFSLFFSQNWGTGFYLISIPGCLGIFGMFMKFTGTLKPKTAIPTIPLYQYPFGNEKTLANIFQTCFYITSLLLLVLGYESIISPKVERFFFKVFLFIIFFIYITCFHITINHIWNKARIELLVIKKGEKQKPSYEKIVPTLPEVERHTIHSPSQVKFEKFTLLNIVLFIIFLLVLSIDFLGQNILNIILIQLPGTIGTLNDDNAITIILILIQYLEPILLIVVMKQTYKDVYDYNVEHVASELVKIEPDNRRRDKIIAFLEKIKEFRKLGIG